MSRFLATGMIKGMSDMGATVAKYDSTHIYFDVKIGSEIDDKERLKRANDAFFQLFVCV